jgi:folate-dependent phosphoribosylglycinamide formyltransferase PurN
MVAMASGGGRTVLNLHDRIESGDVKGGELRHVFVSRTSAAATERCAAAGLEVHVPVGDVDESATAFLDATKPDIVLLCGYLRHLNISPTLEHRVLNIHPALLPDFGGRGMYGSLVHEAVLKAGAIRSGCTVHLVDDVFDHGPIVLQRTCEVYDTDDASMLAARIFALECEAFPAAVRLAIEGRLRLHQGCIETAPLGQPWPDRLFGPR